MLDQIINKIISEVADELPAESLQKIQSALYNELGQYNITPKSTDLVVYTGTPQLLKLYLASKKVDGISKATEKNYRLTLTKFLARLQKDPLDVSAVDIRMYLALRESEGINKGSQGTLLSILKSFYSWLETEEYIVKSPCRKIKNIKQEKHVRKPLNPIELERVRLACKSTRDHALCEFLYSTGCRLDELYKLNRDDIGWKDESCFVFGKGSKERQVFLNAKSLVHLEEYLANRTDDNPALFVTERAPYNRLGRRGIEKVFSRLGEDSGIGRRVYPHLMRHTVATDMLKSGASITVVQKILGHTNPATTQIYAQLDNEDIRSEHKKHVA